MKQVLKILLLEDDRDDAHLIESFLKEGGLSFECTLASSKQEFIKEIEAGRFDLIISDHSLPRFSSIEALRICNEKKISTPFILVTGAISDQYAATMLQEGASDYILKDRLQRLPSAIRMIMERQKIQLQKSAAEEALKKSNERFELAAMASFDLIWDYDPVNKTIYCNEALEKNFGYGQEILSSPSALLQYVHPQDLEDVRKSIAAFLKQDGARWNKQLRIIRADHSVAYVKTSALLLRDENNSVYRITGVLQDITEIVNLEHDLHRQRMIRQREITETTIQAQEKERNEIAKELHDNVNQLLATAKIMIDAALSTPDMQDELLRISQDSILSAIQEIRSITHSMMPPSLHEDHLIQAITDIVQRIELSGALQVSLDLPKADQLNPVDEKVRLTIYRIIQEQTNNILKYAHAERASISIEVRSKMISLTISDNGKGFDSEKRTKGIGLKNIENRTEMLDGKMEIISAPGKGCTLKVEIPLVFKEAGSFF
jgi:two-component system sensor histidine kinase UhpB